MKYFGVFLLLFATLGAYSQPRVFLIDEQPDIFESLDAKYSTLLYSVCSDSIDIAFKHWRDMAKKMESYAKRSGFEIDGVKMWIKVYWNRKGYIEHIGYSVKPSSRSVDTDLMSAFLLRFMQWYKMDIKAKSNFSHYTSISFPVN